MATAEEVMMTFIGRDNVSGVAAGIDKNVQGMAKNAMSAVNNMNAGFMNISSSVNGMLGGLTGGKTASDLIFGTSSKAETNKVLLKNMTETAAGAESLYKTVDDVTNKSLVSMQELIPSMNAFKAATGASDSELTNVTDDMANFGAAVLAQTGSTELAQTAMMDLSKGIKGAFASLDQYGVSEDALMRTGLWTGKEDDVEGYMAAVTEVIGSTEELMQTNEGLDAQIGKAFSRAGKKLGNEFLPFIKDIKKGFLDLDSAMGGNLTTGILAVAQGVDMVNSGLSTVSTMVNDLRTAWGDVKGVISGAKAAIEGFKSASNVTETASNVSEMSTMISSAAAHANYGGGGGVNVDMDIDDDELQKLYDKLNKQDADLDNLDKKSKNINKKSKTVSKQMTNTTKSLGGIGKLAPSAAAASSSTATFSSAFAGFGASLGSLIAPILMVAAVIAIIIPIIGALAAEALIVARAVAELIKALDFDSLDLSGAIEGIKQIGSAMWELARAMGAMTLAGAITLVYNFITNINGFKSPIQDAVNHLKSAVGIINQLSGVASIDESIPGKLESLSTSLQSVGTAMGSMGDVTWIVLMGGLMTLGGRLGSFTDNLRVAKTELTNAVNILNEFGSLGTVNEGVVNKLKAVTDTLSSAGEAMGKIGDINWAVGMTNLNPFSDVASALEQTRTDIIEASQVLNTFTGIQDIPEGVGTKLQNVATALDNANKALQALSKIDSEVSFKGGNPFKDVIVSLRIAKSDIMTAATELSGFSNLPEIPEDIKTKLNTVGSTVATMTNTMKPLNQLAGQDIDSGNITSKVQQARYAISNASTHLASLAGIAQIPENIPVILNKVGSTAATAINTMKPLNQLAGLEVNSAEISSKIAQVRYAISNTATHLGSLGGIATIPENLDETLNRVGTTVTQVSKVANRLNTIPVVTATTGVISLAVTAVKNAVKQLNQLAGTSLNGGIGGLLTSVTNALNQLKTTISAMSGGFYTSGVSIGTSIVNGVRAGLAPLSGITVSSVASATGSAASTGWSGGARIGSSVTGGFKSALKLADAMKTEMSYVKQAVENGLAEAKRAAEGGAKDIVAAFESGYNKGSPGDMAWDMHDEMRYVTDFIISEGKKAVIASKKLGQSLVTAFGSPQLNIGLNSLPNNLNMAYIGSLQTMLSTAPNSSDNRPVEIHIHEGAVQLDARNLTTKESKQVMINALEGLDAVQNVNIRGIGA